ncbi:MAG: serine/threonine protein kinase, partial [Alphaproteobacteria bacterium]|nr:serine/threonine protein kinase [Alphaproteobacteria bacterium]
MLQAGEVVDRYVIEAPIGEGGMGVVYRARHRSLGGEHAIKVLRARSRDVVALALAEGRLQSGIRHPNVAMVTDIIETPEGPALVMEYVDGPDLRTWLRLDAPPLKQRLAVFDGVVQGVAAAHAHGLVHRDIKPGNILLAGGRATPFPKVTDFGLAQAVAARGEGPENWNMVGTPGYMAPEQARNPDQV